MMSSFHSRADTCPFTTPGGCGRDRSVHGNASLTVFSDGRTGSSRETRLRPRNAEAVKGRGTAPDFVKHEQLLELAACRMFAVSCISTMKGTARGKCGQTPPSEVQPRHRPCKAVSD